MIDPRRPRHRHDRVVGTTLVHDTVYLLWRACLPQPHHTCAVECLDRLGENKGYKVANIGNNILATRQTPQEEETEGLICQEGSMNVVERFLRQVLIGH